MSAQSYVRWFGDIRLKDVPEVGGKTASLGELYSTLAADGVEVPDGFALTARAYRDALAAAGAWDELRRLLSDLDHHDVALLAERAAAARQIVYEATGSACCARRSPRPIVRSKRSAAPGSRSRCAVRRPPKICRPRALPGSTRVS